MSTPSIIVGRGNWGVKTGNLLGYSLVDSLYLPREFTCSRADNTATRVNRNGNIEGVNANVPRIDYLGGQASLLVEPSAQNAFIESQTLFTTHLPLNLTTTGYTNAATSPDGSVTAEKFVPNTASGVHGIANGSLLAITSGTTYTLSLFVKSDGGPYNLISLTFDSSTAWGATRNCIFNASNGTNFAVPSGATMTSENYGNGWYRIRATLTAVGTVAAATFQYRIYVTDASGNLSWAGPSGNTNGVFCWGAQLETGSVATSYIPTTAGTGSRSADVISVSGAVSGSIGQTEGTVYCEFEFPNADKGDVIRIDSGSDANVVEFVSVNSTAQRARIKGSSGSFINLVANPANMAINTRFKIAIGYKTGDFALYINGVSQSTDASAVTFNAAFNRVLLGPDVAAGRKVVRIFAAVLYPTRLTNAELATLTAP